MVSNRSSRAKILYDIARVGLNRSRREFYPQGTICLALRQLARPE